MYFQAASDRLTLTSGQRYAYVNVSIVDNKLPEKAKSFTVHLMNPGGGAAIGKASIINVIIQHSDQAYGMFQFDDQSLTVNVKEMGNAGYTPMNLRVREMHGA